MATRLLTTARGGRQVSELSSKPVSELLKRWQNGKALASGGAPVPSLQRAARFWPSMTVMNTKAGLSW
jgi:hypothetical protein